MGQQLGVGAHLASLRRTALAEFGIGQAVTLEQAESSLCQTLIHPRCVLPEMPCVTATEESVSKIRHGQAVNLPEMSKARLVKVFAGQSELIAIASRVAGTLFQPKVVFG
jgi:tRNA pseudouridine55 synthase